MQSLSESQWDCYFQLRDEVARLPARQRLAALQSPRAGKGKEHVASLLRLTLALSREPDRCRTGERIRNLVLGERIGSGGMGVVYRAAQVFSDGIQRDVAVKLIHPALFAQAPAEARARFQQEIGMLAKLEHRGIARIYDGGLDVDSETGGETLFFAMELVHGEPITAWLGKHRDRLDLAATLRLFLQVCDAIGHAHRQGIIHRDLKPANIMIDANNEPRVIDFGLAQTCSVSAPRQGAQMQSGTPAYMSPEQRNGESALTPASDVYALGAILRELLGERPASPDCDGDLTNVIAAATSSEASDRFQSVKAFSGALAGCLKKIEERWSAMRRYRHFLIGKVQQFWIDGVLKKSLPAAVLMELGLALRQDATHHPWEAIVQSAGPATFPLAPGTRIGEVFHDLAGAMLILGQPGAGKTTQLLELARDLLTGAMQNESRPVPVVLHLSTWADQRLSLADWLVDELDKRYDLPPGAARACLAGGELALLLDGLDEVAPVHRAECVAAINAFRKEAGSVPLAVCSRTADYGALPLRLRLAGAVVIQSLTTRQINAYVERVNDSAPGLCAALRADESLQELLETPLMLGIAAHTYGTNPGLHVTGTLEQRRTQLFAAYGDAMFTRRGRNTQYSQQQCTRWLGWLAATMLRHHQSVFYLEWMQPGWLARPIERWAAGRGSVALFGTLFGMVVGLCGGLQSNLAFSLAVSLACGLGGGMVVASLGYGDRIRPITRLRWSPSTLREGVVRKLAVAVGVGLLLSAGVGMVLGTAIGVAIGAGGTLALCYFGGMDLDLVKTDAWRPASPNEGMRQSLRNAGWGCAAGALIGGLAGALAAGWSGALLGTLVFAMIVAMIAGAHPCMQHFMVRALLWRAGCAPWNYVRFLDYAVGRIFMQRLGGGYGFVHRELLEHFARKFDGESC
ncbi:MAG: protein kinase [Betaproteobacteria bacterium]